MTCTNKIWFIRNPEFSIDQCPIQYIDPTTVFNLSGYCDGALEGLTRDLGEGKYRCGQKYAKIKTKTTLKDKFYQYIHPTQIYS